MHNCKSCKHEELRYCPACECVYCKKCGAEWGEHAYDGYPIWNYADPIGTETVTYTEGGSWIDN